MRVTQLGSSAAMQLAVTTAASRVQSSSQDLSSGRRIRTVADAPTDAATVLRYNAHQSALASQKKAGQDAQAWLQSSDTALQSASSTIQSVLTTVQSAGSPALDATARSALADQLDALGAHLLDLANSTAQGRSLFGGFSDAAFTRAADGTVTFTGDDGAVNRQVSASEVVRVNTDGADAFGFTAGDDIFTVIRDASTALRAGDTAAATATLPRVTAGHDRVLAALETVGNAGVAVQSALDAGAAQELTLTQAKSDLVDTDVAKAVMDSQLAAVGYQAALAAVAKADLPTLADYLR